MNTLVLECTPYLEEPWNHESNAGAVQGQSRGMACFMDGIDK